MAETILVCWKCGASLEQEPLPLARLAECRSCHADLHVCRLCEFFDPRVARQCREPVAEDVQDKERANFCGYFQPRPAAFGAEDAKVQHHARRQLDALFCDHGREPDVEANATDPLRKSLDDLFGE